MQERRRNRHGQVCVRRWTRTSGAGIMNPCRGIIEVGDRARARDTRRENANAIDNDTVTVHHAKAFRLARNALNRTFLSSRLVSYVDL